MNTRRLYLTIFGTWLVLWVGCSTAVYYFAVRGPTLRPASVSLPTPHPIDCDEPFYDKGVPVVLCHESGRTYRITEDNAP